MIIEQLLFDKINDLIRGCEEKFSLNDCKIWICASSKENKIIETTRLIKNSFQSLGATILSHDCQHRYEGEVVQDYIYRADIILILAATPGTSAKALDICHRYERDKNAHHKERRVDINKMFIYIPRQFDKGTISRLLREYKVNLISSYSKSAFLCPQSVGSLQSDNTKLTLGCLNLILGCLNDVVSEKRGIRMNKKLRGEEFKPSIAIITALPKELKSAIAILEEQRIDTRSDQDGIYQEFHHGQVNSEHGGYHRVVIGRCGIGNNNASILATTLISRYPTVKVILMVGIAGGIPDRKAEKHVRLGDIVVCDHNGVIQYDMVKLHSDHTERRPSPRPPSSRWLQRCENYIGLWHGEPSYWSHLDEITNKLEISRPRNGPLIDSPWLNSGRALKHPKDSNRDPNRPKVHMGTIASANTLLKSPELRDELKEKYGAMAVEMESSGIADATYQAEAGFLVIRGICDYANPSKNDLWQKYAAAAAAAFTKGLIESMVVTDI
jgi:nucleoside phosphorylase